TGREAIATLDATPDVAIVLMDIMMPEMDGYQTMQIIRANPSYRRLPIVALTAKAMKGDREKCLEAGASDYLAKPVNTEQLLSALRKWRHRSGQLVDGPRDRRREASGQHPAGRRSAGQAPQLRDHPRRPRGEPDPGQLGEGSPRAPVEDRHRGGAGRRLHARAGRLRAGGDDPPS